MQKTSDRSQGLFLSPKQTGADPVVSVIVTTKNEENNIRNCLQSVNTQSFKDVELIVMDNFSDDRTVEIAEKCGAKVYSKGPERSSQRNYGVRVSGGEYLLYLDADMILSPEVIKECVKKCEIDRFDALYIPERIVGEGFWIKVRDFERSFYNETVIDAVRFVRKDLFERIGGFDESLTGPEDWDLDRKIRKIGRTGIINAALCHNEGKFSMARYLSKKKYYAIGFKEYVRKWGSDDSETIKQTGLWYRLVGVFVERGKWKKLIRHPLLSIAMYYLKFRVALEYSQSTM
ncbi:MAG TPA: glycosyltransferase [Candidatus Bathyarchaeia archaeon]|nr:glycosyltransferase [Candidatus Bathyarchaeia archaeon]